MAQMEVFVNIADAEPVKETMALFKAMLYDDRVPENVRKEYNNKVLEIIERSEQNAICE